MTEIRATNFTHDQETCMPGVDANAPYTILEPLVEVPDGDGVRRLNSEEALAQMHDYAQSLKIMPGQIVGFDRHPLAEVLDSLETVIQDDDGEEPIPPTVGGILTTAAKLAERNGFDKNKATLSAQFLTKSPESANPSLVVHSDGLGGIVKRDTVEARKIRIVYPLGPGTLIYPALETSFQYVDVDDGSPSGVMVIHPPTETIRVNLPRLAQPTPEELSISNAQQVMPGKMLAFDPTRTFWHQAPESDSSRLIFVIDIDQTE